MKKTDQEIFGDITDELEDKRSSFYDLVAEKVAKLRGVAVTDDLLDEIRRGSTVEIKSGPTDPIH